MGAEGRRRGDRVWKALLLAINALVLLNALLHDPGVGYDAADHLGYVEVLSHFRLPVREETLEYFSPPLPYLAPALLRAGGLSLWGAGKAAQLLNVVFSAGLTLCLVRLCERVRPGDPSLKIASLATLGMMPVYYKTFSFVRGEPMLAFLCLLAVDRTLALLLDRGWSWRQALVLGLSLGSLTLARQWGFFVFPAVAVFAVLLVLRRRQTWRRVAASVAASFLVAGLAGGWFYLHLREQRGSMRAFNRPAAASFSLSNKPREFYTDLLVRRMFHDPIRPGLGDRLAPILHSEMWGDYWTSFVVYGRDTRDGRFLSAGELYQALVEEPRPQWLETNRDDIAPYLGRVNLVSLPLDWILLAGAILGGFATGRYALGFPASLVPAAPDRAATLSLTFLVVLFTSAGYGWFLLMYPRPDTIKATYLLQAFPFLALLTAELLLRLREKRRSLFLGVAATGLVAILHNLPVMVTRHLCAW